MKRLKKSTLALTFAVLHFLNFSESLAVDCTSVPVSSILGSNTLRVGDQQLITSEGNVGIGSPAPIARLEVMGSDSSNNSYAFRASDAGGITSPLLSLENGGRILIGNPNKAGSQINLNSWTTVSGDLTVTGASMFTQDVSFNPDAKFSFPNRMTIGRYSSLPSSTSHKIYIQGNSASTPSSPYTYSLLVQDNFSKTLLVAQNKDGVARVGVGTSTPTRSLDVAGSIRLRTGYLVMTPLTSAAQPEACNSALDGAVVMTQKRTLCLCNSSKSKWVAPTAANSDCVW